MRKLYIWGTIWWFARDANVILVMQASHTSLTTASRKQNIRHKCWYYWQLCRLSALVFSLEYVTLSKSYIYTYM